MLFRKALLSLDTKFFLNYADCVTHIFIRKTQCVLVGFNFVKETVTILTTMLLHIRVVIDHDKHFHNYSSHSILAVVA